MSVKIGEAVSMNEPEDGAITPDDRQELVKVFGSVVVQDYGHIEAGDTASWKLQFDKKNWELVKSYWHNRVIVNVQDAAKQIFQARIVVKSYSRVNRFPDYINASIELWRI